jgi:hypothetical protein
VTDAIKEIEALIALREEAPQGEWVELRHMRNTNGELSYGVALNTAHPDDVVFSAFHYHEATWPHITWRPGALASNIAAANATEALRKLVAVAKCAERIPFELLAKFLDHEQKAGRWGGINGSFECQNDLRSLDAALQAAKETK